MVADLCVLGAARGRGPPALAPLPGRAWSGKGPVVVFSRSLCRSPPCAKRCRPFGRIQPGCRSHGRLQPRATENGDIFLTPAALHEMVYPTPWPKSAQRLAWTLISWGTRALSQRYHASAGRMNGGLPERVVALLLLAGYWPVPGSGYRMRTRRHSCGPRRAAAVLGPGGTWWYWLFSA
jgi:hypothetical protein